MSSERDRESLVIPGLENPKEIIQLGSEIARQGRVSNCGNLEISTVIGAYGGNKYRVVYERRDILGIDETLDVIGGDMGVTIISEEFMELPSVYMDYYFGHRNIRDVLSGLDPITELPASDGIGVDHEKAENSDSSKIVAVGSSGFYTRRGPTLFVVAKTIDDAKRVYASLLEQHNRFSVLRAAFSEPDNLPFVYMTPEQYENMPPTPTPEEIKASMDGVIKKLLGYLYPDDNQNSSS